jgi:hypothetical protein
MRHVLSLLVFTIAAATATDALAYIGPGAGISAIGSLLALVATVALAILGFVWYPLKRMRRRRRQKLVDDRSVLEKDGPA